MVERTERGKLPCLFLVKALSLSLERGPYDLIVSQRAHLQIRSHWVLGYQYINWGGETCSLLHKASKGSSRGQVGSTGGETPSDSRVSKQ